MHTRSFSHATPAPRRPSRSATPLRLASDHANPHPAAGGAHDPGTLLGLYRGYDRARIALGKLAAELSRAPAPDANTPPALRDAAERGAQAAAFAAFSLVCEQAEALRRQLRTEWPELGASLEEKNPSGREPGPTGR